VDREECSAPTDGIIRRDPRLIRQRRVGQTPTLLPLVTPTRVVRREAAVTTVEETVEATRRAMTETATETATAMAATGIAEIEGSIMVEIRDNMPEEVLPLLLPLNGTPMLN